MKRQSAMQRWSLLIILSLLSGFSFADQKDGKMEIEKLSDKVYLHVSYNLWKGQYTPSNGLVVVFNQDAYIIDTPWLEADTVTLVNWIQQKGFQLKASIATHFHDDRASGIQYLNSLGVKTVASELTNQLLNKNQKATAKLGFKGKHFELADGKIQAFFPGPGHTMDNIVVFIKPEKLLVGGCLIRSAAARGMGYSADGSVKDWADSVTRVIHQFADIDRVIPGHGQMGDQALLTHTIQLANQFQH